LVTRSFSCLARPPSPPRVILGASPSYGPRRTPRSPIVRVGR
jgi:hypothetical protein